MPEENKSTKSIITNNFTWSTTFWCSLPRRGFTGGSASFRHFVRLRIKKVKSEEQLFSNYSRHHESIKLPKIPINRLKVEVLQTGWKCTDSKFQFIKIKSKNKSFLFSR